MKKSTIIYSVIAILITLSIFISCKIVSGGDGENKVRDIYSLKIGSGEISPWAETEYIPCESPEAFMASRVNGYVVEHQNRGLIEGFIQDLAAGSERSATILAMDFGSSAKATDMYNYKKSEPGNNMPLSGISESIAIVNNNASDGCSVFFHFDRFYFEISFWGYSDKTEALKDAKTFVQHFQSRINSK